MSERKHPFAECESCPLNTSNNTFVPTQMPDEVELTVVGEAPGLQETAYGRPFSGPSGKLIKKVLTYHDIDPRKVTFTNATLCRPEDNATPPKAAVAACHGRLLREIGQSAQRGGRTVLALGGTAASVCSSGSGTITSLRIGPAKQPTQGLRDQGVERVVSTWHPAYCLRTADAFPALVTDVGKVKETGREPWVEPDIRVFDDAAGALACIAELRVRTDVLVVDIEVGIDKDESFDHPNEYDLLCVGLAYAKGRTVVLGSGALADREVLDALGTLLRSKFLVAHNGKFDFAGLFPILGDITYHFDTMLAHYCLDETPGGHGLKVLAVEELGAPAYDDEIKQYVPKRGNYADIPRDILYRYNALDVACTWDLYELFVQRLARPVKEGIWPYSDRQPRTLRDVHDFLVAAGNQIKFLELNGINFDYAYNDELRVSYLERLRPLEETMNEIVNSLSTWEQDGINPRSPKQLKEYFKLRGLPVETTNVEALKAMLERLNPTSSTYKFVETLLAYRREQKLYSVYVIGLRKRAYRRRIYTTYTLHGTTSGRLASKNPNLQNIVRDKQIRKQFVAKEGNVLIQCDYKQAEGRVITTLAQDEYLRSIFADPTQDLFDTLGMQLYGVPKEQLHKEMRIRTKAFFYGLGYGREAASIAHEFKMPLAEARQLMEDFMDLIPSTAQWQRDIRQRVLSGKDLITPFGRRRRFHLITRQNQHMVLNEALSFLPQSTASDICLGALTELRPRLKGLGWIRLTIHDALVTECPEKYKDEVAEMMQECMRRKGTEFTDYVPFETDVSFGTHWGEL